MATIVTRETTQTDGTSPKGSPLTNAEVDTNFINLNDDKVEVSGAIIFQAKAGEALSKGDVVYVSGVSGNEPVVSKADADDAAKMPAYGLAEADASLNAAVNVVTFGTLYDLDTSSFAAGDTVYVSTTAGAITTTAPTGESSLLQNIGTVIRSHASAGSIKVGGAGRTNATPNLNDGNVFIGNASNQAAARALTTADIQSGTFADARIAESNVTQHQAALSITESQISDLQAYLTAESDTLDSVTDRGATTTNAVTVGNLTSTGIDDNATSTAVTIDSSQDVTFTSDAKFPDNGKAIFGAGSDLQIYHDGSHSRIDEQGTGVLFLQTNGTNIQLNKGTSENMLVANVDGSVDLYYDNSKKLATTSTGIDVTGTAVTDGLTVAGNVSVDGGTIKLDGNFPTGTNNVALGNSSLNGTLTGQRNVAIGTNAGNAMTSGERNTIVGYLAGSGITTGVRNVAIGEQTFLLNTTGSYNTAVGTFALINNTADGNTGFGYSALFENTSGTNNVAVGYQAAYANTTGSSNTALGQGSLSANTTASSNTALGKSSLNANTTGAENSAGGKDSLASNTTGSYNTAFGSGALVANTTAMRNTALGYQALDANQTGNDNVAVGHGALTASTSEENCAIGYGALESLTTGARNTALGYASGNAITTGAKNTIVGRFSGNQGGLDIRTSSNHIVLSDGDGNPRGIFDNSGNLLVGTTSSSPTTKVNITQPANAIGAYIFASGATFTSSVLSVQGNLSSTNGSYVLADFLNGAGTGRCKILDSGNIQNTNNSYAGFSDAKLKTEIVDAGSQWNDIKALRFRKYKMISDPEQKVQMGVIAQEVEEAGMSGLVEENVDRDLNGNDLGSTTKSIKYSVLYLKAVKALQEAIDRIETLEAEVAALKGA